jgi:hypothetical protein
MVDSHHSGMRSLGPDRSRQEPSLLIVLLLEAYDLFFGCHHSNLSRVFTIDGNTYRVCLGCGAKFAYSLATMSLESGPKGGIHEKTGTLHTIGFHRALRTR